MNSTVPPVLASLASLACALSALRLLRLFAYSVAPLVSVPGEVTPLPGGLPRLLALPGIGGRGGSGT